MQDPHLFPLEIENRAQLKHARIFLAHTREGDYSLHVRIFSHGMHEDDTLDRFLSMEESVEDCSVGGGEEDCWWLALGKKENANAAAIIDATFDRYRKHLDPVLELTWDWLCAMRNIGRPDPFENAPRP